MNALAYYMLGLALKDLGQDEDAYIAWRTAAALSDPSPEHAWVRERAGGLLDMCAQPTSPSAA